MKTRRMMTRQGRRDINDLVAAIIAQARFEWEAPTKNEFRSVCWGDEVLGFEPCQHRYECYPGSNAMGGRGQRYEQCQRKRDVSRRELLEFFHSRWFDFLCSDVDPAYARQVIGVPEL